MARREVTITTYTDDLTGEEIPEDEVVTVKFSYGGSAYKIDLTPKNAEKLDALIAPYIDAASPDRAVRSSSNRKPSRPSDFNKEERQAIREWGAAHGFSAGKGRLSAALVEAYNKANG